MRPQFLYENVASAQMGIAVSLTAGGAGDNTEVTSTAVDTDNALSAKLVVAGKAVLAAGKSLFVTVKIADATKSDLSDVSADTTISNAVKVVTSSGGGTVYFAAEKKIDLAATGLKNRYLRFKITPDLDAANTDTAIVVATLELAGERIKPVTHVVGGTGTAGSAAL